jgi:pimeloyl-ACP methyl ester carboxylesterase
MTASKWYFSWKHDLEAELAAGSSIAQTAKGPIEYALRGEESGPVVVGLHGAPGGYDQIFAFFDYFTGVGFRLLSWSRPGYLRTPLSVGRTVSEQADALAALLDTLGIDRVGVIGVSAGAPAAITFAARYPDRIWGLALESAVTKDYHFSATKQHLFGQLFYHDPTMWLYNLIARISKKSVAQQFIEMEGEYDSEQSEELLNHILQDPAKVRTVMDLIKSMSPIGLRKEGLDNDLEQLAVIGRLPFENIAAPTLIVHGSKDADVTPDHADHAEAHIPDAELYWVEDGMHLLNISDGFDNVVKKELEFFWDHAPK